MSNGPTAGSSGSALEGKSRAQAGGGNGFARALSIVTQQPRTLPSGERDLATPVCS